MTLTLFASTRFWPLAFVILHVNFKNELLKSKNLSEALSITNSIGALSSTLVMG